MPSRPDRASGALSWLEGLSPWPKEFGLGRMHALLARLGNPERAFDAIHVVGTNGKSTTTRMIEELLLAEGLAAAAYLSPHVAGWRERIRVSGEEADLEAALAAVRAPAVAVGATQFEVLTAAALATFRDAGVEVAVVEAGLGGRLDATNVLRTAVVALTNVGLEHTEYLGTTREEIAAEKLAVVSPGVAVVLGEAEWEPLARANGAASAIVEPGGNLALARAAAEAYLGHPVDAAPAADVRLPGRLEVAGDEIRDGAHTPEAVRYIATRLPPIGAIVASILADKDVDGVLRELAALCGTLVATASSSSRALPAEQLAARARPLFDIVETVHDPLRAVARAHELGSPVLVTGSLYLLADLATDATRLPGRVPWAVPPRS
jgi:dihydrofolate synthase/folylpolyglutamate synthase